MSETEGSAAADEQGEQDGEDEDKGPGELKDALAPFAKALVDAAKTEPEGDPNVSRAFALGWHLAELLALKEPDGNSTLLKQIKADVAFLAEAIKKVELDIPKLDELAEKPRDVHDDVLSTLTATDFRLGKAYHLGHTLALVTGDQSQLNPDRVTKMLEWLDELSSTLPPHAAGSVSLSLAQARGIGSQQALRRQGELWRALLSGEKNGREMLNTDDYLDAADNLAKATGKLVRKSFLRFPVLSAAVVLLVIGGVALIAFDKDGSIVAGATSLVAAFGLTWKGLGGAAGKLVAAVEEPVWGAQLDIAIARAMTPDRPGLGADPRAGSRARAPPPAVAKASPAYAKPT
jgi:hypothetical protein